MMQALIKKTDKFFCLWLGLLLGSILYVKMIAHQHRIHAAVCVESPILLPAMQNMVGRLPAQVVLSGCIIAKLVSLASSLLRSFFSSSYSGRTKDQNCRQNRLQNVHAHYAPIKVMPHLPPSGYRWGHGWGFDHLLSMILGMQGKIDDQMSSNPPVQRTMAGYS